MRSIAVIGTGYVGLVTGTCLAELGNTVCCVDTNPAKIDLLRAGRIPFYEPGLSDLIERNVHAKRLRFSGSIDEGVRGAELVFIAVGTPMGADGEADLSQVRSAARSIAQSLDGDKIIINKSTVPVETGDIVSEIIGEHKGSAHAVSVVSNPEFLREGSAIGDFMSPDRIVLGVEDSNSERIMLELYAPLAAKIFVTDRRTAEMIKYASNSFLAMKISFANEIASICDRVGADAKRVIEGAGADTRIGSSFMNPGLGFGGSCFPKDVRALAHIAERNGVSPDLLLSVLDVNRGQIVSVVKRLEGALDGLAGRTIGLLGLAFKPNTDDVRESPAIALAERLLAAGASVIAHDPVAMQNVRAGGIAIGYSEDSIGVADGADAIVLATEWNEYKQIDLRAMRSRMRGDVLFDARNIYEPAAATKLGFRYLGVGRGADVFARQLEAKNT